MTNTTMAGEDLNADVLGRVHTPRDGGKPCCAAKRGSGLVSVAGHFSEVSGTALAKSLSMSVGNPAGARNNQNNSIGDEPI